MHKPVYGELLSKIMSRKNVNLSQIASEGQNRAKSKTGMLFIVLIILQSYFFPLLFAALGFDKMHFWFLSSVITYTTIMISLIIFGNDRLGVFHDYFSLGSITLSCFLSVTFGDGSVAIYKIVLLCFGILFSIYIIANRKTIKLPSARLVFIGILWSVAAVVITALVYVLFDKTYTKDFSQNLLAVIYNSFLFQFTFVTVVEESSYRGLLF
ncbi:MAG: hypothetical protein HY864_03715, partial [Chloroflexi bacterium]|nr:hypothetical protein [Chloroflexota bacterium]